MKMSYWKKATLNYKHIQMQLTVELFLKLQMKISSRGQVFIVIIHLCNLK